MRVWIAFNQLDGVNYTETCSKNIKVVLHFRYTGMGI
jgi:hypothetical protein